MDRKTLIYFFIIVIFFFVVGYLLLSNSAIFKDPRKSVDIVDAVPTLVAGPSPVPQKQVDPAGWLIHTNTREGYSFKYPSNWILYALPEDGDYKFGTTVVSSPSNEDPVFSTGEVKLDVSYYPSVEVIDKDLSKDPSENFAVFTQTYLNKPNSDDGFDTIVTCTPYNLWTGGKESATACQLKETNSAFQKPYQMLFFKNNKKFYSVVIFGEPNEEQKESLRLFIDNFQLLN